MSVLVMEDHMDSKTPLTEPTHVASSWRKNVSMLDLIVRYVSAVASIVHGWVRKSDVLPGMGMIISGASTVGVYAYGDLYTSEVFLWVCLVLSTPIVALASLTGGTLVLFTPVLLLEIISTSLRRIRDMHQDIMDDIREDP